MTTHVVAVLEFSSTGRVFGIVGLPTEVASNIVSFLSDRTNLVFLSDEGQLICIHECRFPAFGRQLFIFHQTNAIIQVEEDHRHHGGA